MEPEWAALRSTVQEGGDSLHRQQKSWFDRNWQWMLGCGCLVVILGAARLGGLAWFGVSKLGEFMPSDQALAFAEANPEVVETLGSPLELKGIDRRMNLDMSGGVQTADFELPVAGPLGRGTIYGEATRRVTDDPWEFVSCEVEIEETGRLIDVLPPDQK